MVHIYGTSKGSKKSYESENKLTLKDRPKKCLHCSIIHETKTLFCEECLRENKKAKLPSVFTKGSGFTISSMVGGSTSKTETDKDTGERVNRKKFSFKDYD